MFGKKRVGDIIVVQARRSKFKTNEYQTRGVLPIVDQGSDFIAGFTDESERAYEGELPLVIFGDHTCCLKYVDFRFGVGADGTQLLRPIEGVDARYLYYALHTAELNQYGYQRHFKLLKECEIFVPSLETQRRIASILGAYDDLIEVNRRRVALLEGMARGLFEEWFVRFRFPRHEAVPIVDTPDGPLPQGWAAQSLGQVADINVASIKSTNAPPEIGYIDIASVSPGQIDAVNWMPFVDAPGRARRVVRDGSIIWSNVRPNRRSFALVVDPAPDTIASTGFTVLDATAVSFAYLYHWVTTDKFVGYLVGNAGGAAYPAVTATTFERADVTIPTAALMEQFTALAAPMLRQAAILRESNKRLSASRDLLLPRLISGQLSVTAAERELEDAA